MIERYTRPEMAAVWNDHNRYLTWLKVEWAVCEELAKEDLIPAKDFKALKIAVQGLIEKGGVDPKRVDAHEQVTRHDVIAFTTAVAEEIGPISRYIHFGLTSSDVVDTALSLQVQEAGALLEARIAELVKVLKEKAEAFKDLPTIGRSHGIFAEPTSFGLKFAGWHAEWKRNELRLQLALEQMAFGKLSGAVGVCAHWDPAFEERVLKRLGLQAEPVSTQVVPRDRHAEFLSVVALCGASLERMSVELRHLQRSEVGEVMEGFKKGQKGSSAMPHKRNPISSENLTGCARLLRGYAHAAIENIALWHERDISHSSVERVAFPDATILLDYALHRMTGILTELVVIKEKVEKNLRLAGPTVFSGHYLLALVKAGVTREQAYAWVQECALQSFEGQGEFLDLLERHAEVGKYLKAAEIRKLGSLKHQLRNVGELLKRGLRKEI
jgi:adenylosuccinate lyase